MKKESPPNLVKQKGGMPETSASVGKGGFEPPRPKAHDPKSCSSASSDTPPGLEAVSYVKKINQGPTKKSTD